VKIRPVHQGIPKTVFSQIGYQLTDHASFALGYVPDWIHPLDKTAYQESHSYQSFVWNQNIDGFKLTIPTRLQERGLTRPPSIPAYVPDN
jgi:hypothetical protein